MTTSWDNKFMELAKHVSGWSKDRSTKVGCVIADDRHRVVSLGYNGFPRNIDDTVLGRHQRPAKYMWTEHAERNAIYNARAVLDGCTIYIHWYPCTDCARAIIQSGITSLVVPMPDWRQEKWGEHFVIADLMLREAGIQIRWYE